MPSTTIVLARHGETDWNRDRRVQGQADTPLNDAGRTQARELAVLLAGEPFVAVYASDLARASETASIVAEHHGLEVLPEPGLRERHFGTWEGMSELEILERFPDARQGHWGDGEAPGEMADRVVAALLRIAAAHPGGHVLAVAHGGPMRTVLIRTGADDGRPLDNCAVIRVTVEGGLIGCVAQPWAPVEQTAEPRP